MMKKTRKMNVALNLRNYNIAFIYKMSQWMDLVKKMMKQHKGKKDFKEILQLAKAEYSKVKKGIKRGGDGEEVEMEGGRRRSRKGRKGSRKGSRKARRTRRR